MFVFRAGELAGSTTKLTAFAIDHNDRRWRGRPVDHRVQISEHNVIHHAYRRLAMLLRIILSCLKRQSGWNGPRRCKCCVSSIHMADTHTSYVYWLFKWKGRHDGPIAVVADQQLTHTLLSITKESSDKTASPLYGLHLTRRRRPRWKWHPCMSNAQ